MTSATLERPAAAPATYDPFGVLVSQSLASGLSQSFASDAVGDTLSTAWSDSAGAVWLSDEQVSDVHGRWRSESLGGAEPGWSARSYGYDGAGRLTSVAESRDAGGDCQTRTYAFDVDSNRTGAAAFPANGDGDCSTATAAAWSQSFTVDAADRITSSGTAAGIGYDTWGRITALPAALTSTPAAGAASAGYYANDLVRSLSQGGATRTWTLDPAGRLASMTTTGLGSTGLVNHYPDASSDSPAWTVDTSATGTVTTRRYVAGFAGMLAETAITGATTTTTVQLTGLHGDVLRTTTPTATGSPDGPGIYTDEYGRVLDPDTGDTTTGPRYGWLGAKQRPTDTGTLGLTLMGVRLYTPITGRFLSTDPIYGGNETAYGYPTDPVGCRDLTGLARDPSTGGGDPKCAQLRHRIEIAKNRASRRLRQYVQDVKNLAHDPEMRGNYYRQLRGRQANLRKLLMEWATRGCGGPGNPTGGLPSGVWKLATVNAPSPTTVAAAAAAGAAGLGILWWLGKLASPACGPAAPACLVVL